MSEFKKWKEEHNSEQTKDDMKNALGNMIAGLDWGFKIVEADGAEISVDGDGLRISSKGPVPKDKLSATLKALGERGLAIGVPGYEDCTCPSDGDENLVPPVVKMSEDGKLFVEISEKQFKAYEEERQLWAGRSKLSRIQQRFGIDGVGFVSTLSEELESSASDTKTSVNQALADELVNTKKEFNTKTSVNQAFLDRLPKISR